MFFKWVIRDKVERCSVIIPVSYISYRVRASTQHVRIVFGLFIAFSIILRGYLAFASVKMPPKKKEKVVSVFVIETESEKEMEERV